MPELDRDARTDAADREPPASARPEPSEARPAGGRDAATLGELDGLDELPLAAHPDVYQRIHEDLQRALHGIDDA